ncbi:MAG: hypothetical protein JNM95_12190 [Chitinophagaceae bacterium]|nr:hypothetical protein [Chitinophagaceae bacterium]
MFQKLEHISNTIGKRALLLLFYFFVAIQCKSCAIYVFKIQENFKCPLCEFLKDNSPKYFFATSVSFKQILPTLLRKDTEIEKRAISKKQAINNQLIENEQIGYTNKEISIFFEDITVTQKQSPPLSKSNKLYLKYHQLKIGDYTLLEEEINI